MTSVRRVVLAGVVAAWCLVVPVVSASAATLGSLAGGADASACASIYAATGPAYTVPHAGARITAWSTSTAAAIVKPGEPVWMMVLRSDGTGQFFTVVGSDSEMLPSPLPQSGVATFPLSNPIFAREGDVLGLFGGSSAACLTAAPVGGSPVSLLDGDGLPAVGLMYGTVFSGAGYLLNVAVSYDQDQDASVSGAAVPGSIVAGGIGSFGFTVGNNGPLDGPITFTDTVPAGLSIVSAVAGSATCSVTGQVVTCTSSTLAAATSFPVSIVVRADTAGTYADTASVTTQGSDPAPANDTASATLTVTPAPDPGAAPPPDVITRTVAAPPSCKTIALKGVSLALAKRLIVGLHCTVGTIKKTSSKTVKKGLVISTSPGSGRTLTAGAKVAVTESSGPPPKKHKKKTRHATRSER